MAIAKGEAGAVYLSQGMLFVVLSFLKPEAFFGEDQAECLVLDDNPVFTRFIPGGTVMRVGEWSALWKAARLVDT